MPKSTDKDPATLKAAVNFESLKQLLLEHEWPHTREGRKWKTSSLSFRMLMASAKRLSKLGMPHEEIVPMLSGLYWEAFGEFRRMPERKEEADRRNTPHFDAEQIMFRVDAKDLSPEELKKDYQFYFNAHVRDGRIWLRHSEYQASGGHLDDFLDNIRIDNNFAFGPTKPGNGLTLEKLAAMNAVGVYKRKDPPASSTVKRKKAKLTNQGGAPL